MSRAASRLADAAWRLAHRAGFPLARFWWRLRPVPHEGALVAIYVGDDLLLLRSSYRREWNLPGGGVQAGETAEVAARRELQEELGLVPAELPLAAVVSGIWDHRPDRVHVYELHLRELPRLILDNREIVAAQLFSPVQLRGLRVTGPTAAYLRKGGADQGGIAGTKRDQL